MYCVRKIKEDVYYIGASDRRLSLFENVFPIKNGVSYNSYFIDDEKTVVVDTVDHAVSEVFFENIEYLLKGRQLDYVIVNHMELDHSASLQRLLEKYPSAKVIGNAKTLLMIKQFFAITELDSRFVMVEENTSISFGRHELAFYLAPMVHWPECMVSYDKSSKILFSADAFGTFNALNGTIFNDEVNFEKDYLEEARRYYTNIVGKYGPQVLALLKKAEGLDIDVICPLHGPIWRSNLQYIIDKYIKWASYEPEEKGVLIVYGSIYGNTENACNILASNLAELGINQIKMFDVSNTDVSDIVAMAFKYSHIVIASINYNGSMFSKIDYALNEMAIHNLQNRKFAIIENGSWGLICGRQIKEKLEKMKNIEIIGNSLGFKSSLKSADGNLLLDLAKEIKNSF